MSEQDGFAGLTMEFETVVGDKMSATLKGAYQTPDGKWSLNCIEGRYRTANADVYVDDAIADMEWLDSQPYLVTLTFNTAGRVIDIERND